MSEQSIHLSEDAYGHDGGIDTLDPPPPILGVVPDTGTDLIYSDDAGSDLEGALISEPLTTDAARELTDAIKQTSEVLFTLIQRAHAGKAWLALGYSSFHEYVREEFNMSRSRAYQILDQARVVEAIEAALPEGAVMPHISEAAARDLKSVLGEVVPAISDAVSGLESPDEAGHVVEEIVEDYRNEVRERREDDALDREADALDRQERGGGDYNPDLPPMPYLPPPVDDEDLDSDFDPVAIRRSVQAAYDLYSAINALKAMPEDVEQVIAVIPAERRFHITNDLGPALEWLAEFRVAWTAQPFNSEDGFDTDNDAADEDESDEYVEDF